MKFAYRYKSNGHTYQYFKPTGGKSIALKAAWGSPEFFREYADLLAAHEARANAAPLAVRRVEPGTVAALIRAYRASAERKALKPSSRTTFDRVVDHIEADHGSKRLATVTPAWLRKQIHDKAATPAAAFNLLRRWRALFRAGVEAGLLEYDDDPTRGVKSPRYKTEGHEAWKAEDVAKFAQHHGPGSMPFLALVLATESAQRRSDLVKLGPGDLLVDPTSRVIGHGFKQTKTSAEVFAPLTEPLAWALMTTERLGRTTWLATEYGQPFTVAGFGMRFAKWARAANVNKPLHGLRKYGLTKLIDDGAHHLDAMALSGHSSPREFMKYIGGRDRRALSIRAFGGGLAKAPISGLANASPDTPRSHMAPRLFAAALADRASSALSKKEAKFIGVFHYLTMFWYFYPRSDPRLG